MENSTDLVAAVSKLAEAIPQIEDDIGLTFLPDTLLALPSMIETNQLIITLGTHSYGSWRIDYPQVSAPKPVYEALGIATAAVLLKPELDELTIRLTNPSSEVRELRISFSHSWKPPFGLHQTPTLFEYWPGQVKRHPWFQEHTPNPGGFPHVQLTNAEDLLKTEDDWNGRDVLVGFGSAQATARMVQLFLDMSRESNDCAEFALEGEAGFRGVAPASAEIRFWLPGGDFYIESDL